MSYDPCPNHPQRMAGSCPECDTTSSRELLDICGQKFDPQKRPPRAPHGCRIVAATDYEERPGGLRLPVPLSRTIPQ